jgi:hypothetical protein
VVQTAQLNRISDPVLFDFPLPLTGYFYPMGFPLAVATNSEHILAAVRESWSMFPQRFGTDALRLRIGVTGREPLELPRPKVRAQGNLISFIGDSENFSIGDLAAGFGYAWLSNAAAENQDFLRYHYLDSLTLTLIDALHVCTVHAACVVLDGHGVLLCGASGAGKSTLAYACAKSGWQYVCDDASSLLKERKDRTVIGNPHRLRLLPDAGRLFPEFQHRPVSLRMNGKLCMEIATANEQQISRVSECRVDYVVFLEREEGPKAVLSRMPKEPALAELASVIAFGSPETRQERIACYENLLQVPTFRMKYNDLDSAVDCLAGMVERDFKEC